MNKQIIISIEIAINKAYNKALEKLPKLLAKYGADHEIIKIQNDLIIALESYKKFIKLWR